MALQVVAYRIVNSSASLYNELMDFYDLFKHLSNSLIEVCEMVAKGVT